MQFTYMIQRILTEVSSTLMLLVKNTNTHIVKTVVYYFSVVIVISWECH